MIIEPKDVKIVVSLTSRTIDYMLFDGLNVRDRTGNEKPNMLELRLDYINPKELTERNIGYLIRGLAPTPLIITVRHKSEAPPNDPHAGFKGSERERAKILHYAAINGANYISMEFKHPLTVNLEGTATRIILDNHNFERTPSLPVLRKLYEEMNRFRPDSIKKIVTSSNGEKENQIIFGLLDEFSKNGDLVALAMGEKGRQTRTRGALKGSLWTYGCSEESTSAAPGQMTVGRIRAELDREYRFLQ